MTSLRWLGAICVLTALAPEPSSAHRALPDYRYFRALSLDLQGRPPTLDELDALDQPTFQLDAWIDRHLAGPAYAERIRRIYMDELRLESAPTTSHAGQGTALRRATITGPHGQLNVYFRINQRRADPAIDGAFCFTEAESGLRLNGEGVAVGTPVAVSEQLLDARTVLVKPWWLYADYRAASPKDRGGPGSDWAARFPGYRVLWPMFVDADGAATTAVRVCREEAQTAARGHVVATGRVPKAGGAMPVGRYTWPPFDGDYAKAHAGELIACSSGVSFETSPECGCGVGLEACLPLTPQAFVEVTSDPLGADDPVQAFPRTAEAWMVQWWAEEAKHFLDDVFGSDRDVRELLVGRGSVINGPLAQFYRLLAGQACCGAGEALGYAEPEPLFDPRAVPAELIPEDTTKWVAVADRGPRAAGVLTMPVFLLKYGPRRARAHVLYTTFLCKDFVAESAELPPSTEPDLARRPGCATCHATLEPMAAYFSRVAENDWTYLPEAQFPLSLPRCAGTGKKRPLGCTPYYDPAFATATSSSLRGARDAPDHAAAGPHGLGEEIASSPAFAPCVVRTVAQSLLGRTLSSDDDGWRDELARQFVAGGYRMRALVRAILTSPRYRDVNDATPAVPR
jgi:hypothetical protein